MSQHEESGWAYGGIFFASIMMIVLGFFGAIEGLAALLKNDFYVVTKNYFVTVSVTGWGWIHLILGVLIGLAGIALLAGQTWARVVGIIAAGLIAIANFFFIPIYPLWSIIIIALAAWVIWALAAHGADMKD